jgi:hypothetical protein
VHLGDVVAVLAVLDGQRVELEHLGQHLGGLPVDTRDVDPDKPFPAPEEVGQVLEAALGDPGVGDQVNIHPAAPSRPPKVAAGP